MKYTLMCVIIAIIFLSLLNLATPFLVNYENDIIFKNNLSAFKVYNQLDNITWDVRLNFSEPGGAEDYVIFGEATNATDGPPHDQFDAQKPPAPPEPYIRAWLYDNMDPPFNLLFYDYRSYPDTEKVWNLTIIWIDVFPPDDTTVNISWNTSEFDGCEYDSVVLCNDTSAEVADMLTDTYYSFECEDSVLYYFTINCSLTLNQPPFVINNYPLNESIGVERPPAEINVTIEDLDSDTMDIYISWKNHEEVWLTLENYSNVSNGTYNFIPSGNDWIWGNTTYVWNVNITDGTSWTNETYSYTTGGNRYDVNNDDNVNFQDAGLVWVHRTSEVPYDGIYDVNQDGQVNFQDAGLTWVNRD